MIYIIENPQSIVQRIEHNSEFEPESERPVPGGAAPRPIPVLLQDVHERGAKVFASEHGHQCTSDTASFAIRGMETTTTTTDLKQSSSPSSSPPPSPPATIATVHSSTIEAVWDLNGNGAAGPIRLERWRACRENGHHEWVWPKSQHDLVYTIQHKQYH